MITTQEIIYCLEEVVKDIVKEELEKEGINQEIIEKVIERDKCVEFDNQEEVVIQFIQELLGVYSKKEIKNLIKQEHILDEYTKKLLINGIMDCVIQNNHLDTLEKIYNKKENIDNVSYNTVKKYESFIEQLIDWTNTLYEYGYYNLELVGINRLFKVDRLLIIIEIIETFGNWLEIKNEIAKGILLGKDNPFKGYQLKLMVTYERDK